jgi:hypothetical protein
MKAPSLPCPTCVFLLEDGIFQRPALGRGPRTTYCSCATQGFFFKRAFSGGGSPRIWFKEKHEGQEALTGWLWNSVFLCVEWGWCTPASC